MRTRVQKWGNSLAVRIPKAFAEGAGLRDSSEVEVSLVDDEIRLTSACPRWGLRQLLSRVRAENIHREIPFGGAVGQEKL